MADLNQLTNIKVIQCGLSDEEQFMYPKLEDHINTGGMTWFSQNKKEEINLKTSKDYGKKEHFVTLDSLIENKTIDKALKIIHLDVEGHEHDVLKGAKKLILKYKPYFSLESHKDERESFEQQLGLYYKFVSRLNINNTFEVR